MLHTSCFAQPCPVVMTPISNCLSEISLRTKLKIFVVLHRDSIRLFDAPPSREEVHLIFKSLPKGSSGGYDQITYEHILYGGPVLWDVPMTCF